MFKEYFPACTHTPDWSYWDSAATALKLGPVLEAQQRFESQSYATVHRSSYQMAARATEAYEEARAAIAEYFGAAYHSCVFVRGATEGINLFAEAVVSPSLKPGTNIVVSQAEHHANYWVWKALCAREQAELRVARVTEQGQVDSAHVLTLIDEHTRAVAVTHASNVTGAVNDLFWLRAVRDRGVWVLVDGAQYAAHQRVSIDALGCDAYVVSAHKMCGPSGIGVVFLSERAGAAARPYQWGGGMAVFDKNVAVCQSMPWCFEAGTPHIGGAVGFAQACAWWSEHRRAIDLHQSSLKAYWYQRWASLGFPSWTDPQGIGIISFEIPGLHPHDVATWCDQRGVALRAGMHCAGPLLHSWGKQALVRASMGVYTDKKDVDALMHALEEVSRHVLE